jgi:uncharacterized protein (TIGR02246 family)
MVRLSDGAVCDSLRAFAINAMNEEGPMGLPMSSVRNVPLIVGLVALLSGCSPAPAPDTRAQDEAAIRAAEVAWSAAAQAKDLEKSVSYYAADALTLPPNEPKAAGAAEIRKMWASMLATPGLDLTFQTTKVEVARDGDLAYSTGTYRMAMNGPDGKPMSDVGKYATVWKKQTDGSWKVVLDTFNSDVPVPPPPPPSPKKGK